MSDEQKQSPKTGAASVWLIACTLPVAIIFYGHLAKLPSPVSIESVFSALITGQIFYALFLWPFFERRCTETPMTRGLHNSALWLIAFIILSIPLIIITRRVSDVSIRLVIAAEGLVFLVGMISSASARIAGWRAWYYPAAFVWSAVLPFAAYWLIEGGAGSAWAAAGTPFWAGLTVISGKIVAPIIIFGVIALASVFAALLSKKQS